jgi:hypothetical protein
MLGRPLGAQQKEEQRVQNAETAIKESGSVAHRRGSFNAATRGVLGMSCAGVSYCYRRAAFVPQALAFLGPTHQPPP